MRHTKVDAAYYYRALTPRWSHDPLSGEGAAITGGRFNPEGYAALYLSSDPKAALYEAAQSQFIIPPKTVCTYQISINAVVDFSAGYNAKDWIKEWSVWDMNWRKALHIDKRRPATWEIAQKLISDGAKGLLFPSLRSKGHTNLVIFLTNIEAADSISVIDPEGDLPGAPTA